MPFIIPINQARAEYPEYTFIAALTPSEQKAAFHIKSREGQDLCLKIISPSYQIDRLHREILALQSLAHPNVVRLIEYTYSTKPGHQRHFMVEEFVAGTDLAARVVPGTPWTRPQAADFFAPLADGLQALRANNIVHRDLKPTNIRVRPDGTPVIIDFGLARHLDMPDLTKTAEGAAFGTPLYFAPEQANPSGTKRDIDHRTDLFALGVMLHQVLIGRHPFLVAGITNIDQLRDAICNSSTFLQAAEFTGLPAEWKLILGKLLEKDRVKRPQSAAHVATILRKIRGI
jgi:eukaryotic-like serine/threonine-protein kinase